MIDKCPICGNDLVFVVEKMSDWVFERLQCIIWANKKKPIHFDICKEQGDYTSTVNIFLDSYEFHYTIEHNSLEVYPIRGQRSLPIYDNFNSIDQLIVYAKNYEDSSIFE